MQIASPRQSGAAASRGGGAVASTALDRIHGTREVRIDPIRNKALLLTRTGGSSWRNLKSPVRGHAWPGAEPSSSAAQPREPLRRPKSP